MFELIAIGLCSAVAWFAGGLTTVHLRHKLFEPPASYMENDRQIGHAIWGVLWPLYLPVFLMWAAGTGRAKLPTLPVRKSAQQKVLEYSQSPTKVLSQIIAAKIAKEPGRIRPEEQGRRIAYTAWYEWDNTDKNVSVSFSKNIDSANIMILSVVVKETPQTFDDKIIRKALEQAITFNKDKRRADREAAEQLKALEAVESLLLTPEPAK